MVHEKGWSDMWFIIGCTIVCVTGILTDMISKNKKIDLKKLEKEIELEKIRLKSYEIETEKIRMELSYSKQLLLESKGEVK